MKKTGLKELFEIFITFFKIGAFTLGGGYAMLPLIEKEVVENKKWATQEEIIDIFAIAQSVPGVVAVNTSIFVGYKRAKLKGGIAAVLGAVLPSFLIILAIYQLLFSLSNNIYVIKAFAGVRAGVTALILVTAIKLIKNTIKDVFSAVIAVIAFFLILLFDNDILIILAGVILGIIKHLVSNVKVIRKVNRS
ncbi:MAG TPA: chromate transporter [Acetivibrio sp.]|nr:chromate transporter [Clostridium sp.]HOQ36298.1 chromate transporter [Acetivibrio sp.]HPT91336.1 chromate transporter [Acetivibrio sp.]